MFGRDCPYRKENMLKKIGMVLVGATLVVAHCLIGGMAFAQLQDDGQPCPPECVTDSMEIVTWYPSPYNEYEELRLYPISESNSPNGECGQDNRGLMYYDKDDDKVYICKGAIEGWKELGGSGNLPQSTTSSSFCDSNNLGKLIYDTSRNRPYVCALNGSSYVWKPLDSDYDEDGVTDAVDANDNDINDATALEANVETGKTFYARGGSRKTGTFVDDNIKGVCAYNYYSSYTQCSCPVFGWCNIYSNQYVSGEAYLNSACGGNLRHRDYQLCACNSPYNLVQVGVLGTGNGWNYILFECRKN